MIGQVLSWQMAIEDSERKIWISQVKKNPFRERRVKDDQRKHPGTLGGDGCEVYHSKVRQKLA